MQLCAVASNAVQVKLLGARLDMRDQGDVRRLSARSKRKAEQAKCSPSCQKIPKWKEEKPIANLWDALLWSRSGWDCLMCWRCLTIPANCAWTMGCRLQRDAAWNGGAEGASKKKDWTSGETTGGLSTGLKSVRQQPEANQFFLFWNSKE